MIQRIFEKLLNISLTKWRIKLLLVSAALGISVTVILYARYLSDELIARETKIINFYAEIFRHYANPETKDTDDIDFFIYEIAPTISFPIIMTDADDSPLFTVDEFTNDTIYVTYTLNINIDQRLPAYQQRMYLEDYLHEMRANYEPINVELEDQGIILQKFYYTHSALIEYIRYFPILAIIVMLIFIFFGYIAFNYFRKNEESKVWVGMSKEAAHQLGTPLSSLLAWIEIIRLNKYEPEKLDDTLSEMQNDLERLNKITVRFSKIGSKPEMKIKDIGSAIDKVCTYFEKRLPHLGKKVVITKSLKEDIFAEINDDLFEWVMENLLKNAAEAIEEKQGSIDINLNSSIRGRVIITVKDSGKGMNVQVRRQAFNPGFTTKKRGWGLGLSLTKRIIEEYHEGKIFIKESSTGKGTVFQIELPVYTEKVIEP